MCSGYHIGTTWLQVDETLVGDKIGRRFSVNMLLGGVLRRLNLNSRRIGINVLLILIHSLQHLASVLDGVFRDF